MKATDPIYHARLKALQLALMILEKLEPGDSRAVSDEFVAMAAVYCGDISDPVIQVIDEAIEKAKTS